MLKVEVTAEVNTREVRGMKFRNQVAYVQFIGAKYPSMVFIPLGRSEEPLEPGQYTLAPSSFQLEVRYGEPKLGFSPKLTKVAAAAPAPRTATAS